MPRAFEQRARQGWEACRKRGRTRPGAAANPRRFVSVSGRAMREESASFSKPGGTAKASLRPCKDVQRREAFFLPAANCKEVFPHGQARQAGIRNPHHASQRGLFPMVHGRDSANRTVRLRPCARLHDHPSLWLCHLGAHPAGNGQPLQGDRPSKRVFPHADSRKSAAQGSGACGGLCPRGGVGHAGRHGKIAGAFGGSSHQRNHFLHHVLQVGADLA